LCSLSPCRVRDNRRQTAGRGPGTFLSPVIRGGMVTAADDREADEETLASVADEAHY